MVELKAIERAFLHWRARATKNFWRMHRRNSRTMSTLMPESQQIEPLAESAGAPQHSPIELQSARPSSFVYIHAYEAQEEYGEQQRATGFEDEPPQIGLDNHNFEGNIAGFSDNPGQNSRSPPEADLLNLYKELDNLSSKRVRARQSRMALKYKREDEVKLRVSLMRCLNSFFANLDHPEAEPMMREYELLQAATEEYLRMENAYREEEDQLEEQEYLVSISMEGLSRPEKEPALSIQTSQGPRTPVPNKDESIRDLPSCVTTYLSRIGDERILQERLSELESEWFITVDRKAQRDQVSMDLDEDSKDFLSNFDAQRIRLWKELSNAQLDVNSLRTICLDQGFNGFDYENIYPANIYHLDEEEIWVPPLDPLALPIEDQYVFPEDTGATHGEQEQEDLNLYELDSNPKTPKKEPPPPSLESIHQNSLIVNSTDFINKWMLHQLRISSMGIWRLQRSPLWQSLSDQGWEGHDISRAILDIWLVDDGEGVQAKAHITTDDDADTVIEYTEARRDQDPASASVSVIAKTHAQSLPSPQRVSTSKANPPRRHSRP